MQGAQSFVEWPGQGASDVVDSDSGATEETLLLDPAPLDDERFADGAENSLPSPVHVVLDQDARIRTGPPDFRQTTNRVPYWTRVWLNERHGQYARVTGADGTAFGWTDASNIGIFFKDLPHLPRTELGPVRPLTVQATWSGPRKALAQTYNRLGGLMAYLVAETGIDQAAVLAVWYVESGGRAHTAGRAIIRFENHLFFDRWGQAHAAVYDRHFQHGGRAGVAGDRWQNHKWRADPARPFESFHGNQDAEYRVLGFATGQSDDATALQCISIGGPQILLSNHRLCGYETPRAMYDAFQSGERGQLLGFFDYCQFKYGHGSRRGELLRALAARRWEDFTRGYNGTGKVAEYSAKLRSAYADAVQIVPAAAGPPAPRESGVFLDTAGLDPHERDHFEHGEGEDVAWSSDTSADHVMTGLDSIALDQEWSDGEDSVGIDPGMWQASLLNFAMPESRSAAALFDAVVGGTRHILRADAAESFDVIARPFARIGETLEPGDLLIQRALGEDRLAHSAMLATGNVRTSGELQAENVPGLRLSGLYAEVVEQGPASRGAEDRSYRRVADENSRFRFDTVILRPRRAAPTASEGWQHSENRPTGAAYPTLPTVNTVVSSGEAVLSFVPIDARVLHGGSAAMPGPQQTLGRFWVTTDAIKWSVPATAEWKLWEESDDPLTAKRRMCRLPCRASDAQVAADRVHRTQRELPDHRAAPDSTDAAPCLLLTPRLYDLRWEQSDIRVDPCAGFINEPLLVGSLKLNKCVNDGVRKALAARSTTRAPRLLGDPGKIWAITNDIGADRTSSSGTRYKAAVNYGWHASKGWPGQKYQASTRGQLVAQPLPGTAHSAQHIDYSQVCLLVAGWCEITLPGAPSPVWKRTEDVYRDPTLCKLVTHDGKPLRVTSY
jgi:hypothetical protein